MLQAVRDTKDVKVTNTIYQDIVDDAYSQEYWEKVEPEFAEALTSYNRSVAVKSKAIKATIQQEKAAVKLQLKAEKAMARKEAAKLERKRMLEEEKKTSGHHSHRRRPDFMQGYVEYSPVRQLMRQLPGLTGHQSIARSRLLPSGPELEALRTLDQRRYYEARL